MVWVLLSMHPSPSLLCTLMNGGFLIVTPFTVKSKQFCTEKRISVNSPDRHHLDGRCAAVPPLSGPPTAVPSQRRSGFPLDSAATLQLGRTNPGTSDQAAAQLHKSHKSGFTTTHS
ncbi:hypothetical protein MTP99_003242 [Tenebrio molitor]|nr:hypothetical protein MTP99_003242 [Tenebrio molitor]